MSVSEQLAEWICALRYEDIPERVRLRARWQLASTFAAIHAARFSEAAASVGRAVEGWSSAGPCSVLAGGKRLPAHDAVLINSAASMALDYDDYLYMGHTGHSAVLGSLALGETLGSSTRDLLVAQVIANEIGGRVGASVVLGPQNGQAWSFIHAVESAALASKLFGLGPTQTAHALGIALYQPSYTLWPGFMGPGSKLLTAAWPTVMGLQAAAFAREGLTGAPEIFEHPRKGFWASLSWVPLPRMMTGLGQAWVSDTLAFKRYPGCAYIDTTLDALFMVLDEHRQARGRALEPEDVAKLRVDANLLSIEMDNLSSEHLGSDEPLSPINVNFSLPLNIAIAIVAGAHEGRTLEQSFLDANQHTIRALAAKTELAHDLDMSLDVARAFDSVLGRAGALRSLGPAQYLALAAGYRRQLGGKKRTPVRLGRLARSGRVLAEAASAARSLRRGKGSSSAADLSSVDFTRFRMVFPARVTLETTDGKRYSARQDVPWGAPGQDRMRETVEEKLRREGPPERVDALLAAIADYEKTSLAALIEVVRA